MAALQTTTSGRYATTTSSFCFLRSRPRLCASIGCGAQQTARSSPRGTSHASRAPSRCWATCSTTWAHTAACRAWTAAEVRGASYWRSVTSPWLDRARDAAPLSAFGPRETAALLEVGGEPITLHRRSSGRAFTARRLSNKPAAFLLSGFSTGEERDQIVAAGLAAPMREVPRAEEDAAADDDRRGCEVAWLESPITAPDTPWADLMRDAAEAVLPSDAAATGLVPGAGPLEDLHVVKYAKGGAYGLHLDATCAVPRAVTVLHYLNDVDDEDGGAAPGFRGETWLPLADADESLGPPAYGPHVTAGTDGVLVPARGRCAGLLLVHRPRRGRQAVAPRRTPRLSDQVGGESVDASGSDVETRMRRRMGAAAGGESSGHRTSADQAAPLSSVESSRPRFFPRGPGFGPRVIG